MMRAYKIVLFLICFIFCSFFSEAQNHRFYLRATSQNFNPSLTLSKGTLTYNGTDTGLKKVFDENDIYVFKRAFYNSTQVALLQTWYIESDVSDIHTQFLQYASNLFSFGEYIGNEDATLEGESIDYTSPKVEKVYDNPPYVSNVTNNRNANSSFLSYPDDYGATSPVTNYGIPAVLDNFDFIGVPEAWDYTTGSADIIMGLSDGQLLIDDLGLLENDPDFINKTTTFYDLGGLVNNGDGHGYAVGMRMAGQGDNGQGSTGICYDCPIYATSYGTQSYDALLAISNEGARVINCSWRSSNQSDTQQLCINEIYSNGTIVVAAAGNYKDYPLQYPASYEHVISVSGVGHKRDLVLANAQQDATTYAIYAAKNYIGSKTKVDINEMDPIELINTATINDVSAVTRNEAIDINAPGSEVFSYGTYLIKLSNGIDDPVGSIAGLEKFATSAATPQVSGTLGLMLDLNQCLSFEEAESILKITSTYIGDLPAHQYPLWLNRYGSGGLHTGRSVKLVNDLLNPTETAYLENQKFTRWDFEFKGVSEKIEIRNQEFTEGSTLNVLAKNRILIEGTSLIEPNADGNALLEIDPNLTIDTLCDIGTNNHGGTRSTEKEDVKEEIVSYILYPTKVGSSITIEKKGDGESTMSKIVVYDLFNRIVYSNNDLESLRSNDSMSFDLSGLKRGIYIVKGYAFDTEEIITEKIIKD